MVVRRARGVGSGEFKHILTTNSEVEQVIYERRRALGKLDEVILISRSIV